MHSCVCTTTARKESVTDLTMSTNINGILAIIKLMTVIDRMVSGTIVYALGPPPKLTFVLGLPGPRLVD